MVEDDEPAQPTADAPALLPWREITGFLIRHDWVIGATLVVLAFSLRVGGLTGYWLNPDEGIYYTALTGSLSELWGELASNAHPPLYYVLLRVMGLFGSDFVWFRCLSLVSGCLAVWGTFLLGRSVGGVLTGLIAGFLVAVSPGAIVLSQIIRPYMLQLAALTFGLFFLGRYTGSRRGRDLWLYSACMATALLTQYSSFLVLGAVGIALFAWLLSVKPDRTEIWRLLRAHIPILAATVGVSFHLAHLLDSQLQVQAQTGWLEPHMISDLSSTWLHLIGVLRYLFGFGYSGPMLVLLITGLVLAVVRREYAAWVLPVTALALAVVGAAVKQYPFGCSHHVMYLMAILAVPMALPVAEGLRAGGFVSAATGVGVLLLFAANESVSDLVGAGSYPHQPRREQVLLPGDVAPARRLLDQARAGPGLILMQSQTYYTLSPLFRQGSPQKDWQEGDFFRFPWGDKEVLVNSAWLMTTDQEPADPNESFYGFLERIDTALPELDVMDCRNAVLVSAGWTLRLEQDLLTADKRRLDAGSPRTELVVDPGLTYQVDNISVHTIDVRKFVERGRR